MSYKLLIVDDNQGCSDLYKLRFEYDKWEVVVAYCAEKALEILKKDYCPNVILLDMMLPEMQGDELLNIIKSDSKTKDIKVIILSALSLAPEKEEELLKKADDCILKIDIMPSELVKRATKLAEEK